MGGLALAVDRSAVLEKHRPGRSRVVGVAADVCVAATSQDARRLGDQVTVDLGASAFVHAHAGGEPAAMAQLRAAGINILDD